MSQGSQVDYDSLAQKYGAAAAPAVDYDALAKQHGAVESAAPAKQTWMDKVSDFAGEWWKQVNPIAGVQGMVQAAEHPITTGKNMLQAQGELKQKAEDAFKQGNYAEGVRHTLNYLLPVLGPQSDTAGTMLQNPQTRAAGLGMTAGIGTNLAAPELMKGRIPIPGFASNKLQSEAEGLYKSALKPSAALSPAKTNRVIQAGLENQIPVSAGGVEKLGGLIDDLNDKIKAAIPQGSSQTVNKFKVTSRLGDVAKRFETQVNPESDMQAISDAGNEFLRNQPAAIPVEQAQALKQGTYKQLKGRAYGELKSATVESQKALARGLKEEVVNQFPELQPLNAREGRALDLQPILDKAVQRIGNHQLIGIGTPIGIGATKAVTGSSAAAAVAGAMKAVLDNPWVKSQIAFKLEQAAKLRGLSVPGARLRFQGYVNALGQAASAANSATPGSPDSGAQTSQ